MQPGALGRVSRCSWAGVLTIWQAWVQLVAGALGRVFLAFGRHGWSRCSSAGVLTIWQAWVQLAAGALGRVFLQLASMGAAAGCSYHLAVVSGAGSGCSRHICGAAEESPAQPLRCTKTEL